MVAIRASARWPSPVDITALPRTGSSGHGRRAGRHRRARLHRLGGAGVAGRRPPGRFLAADASRLTMDAGGPAGADLAADRGGDRDGRGAAPVVSFPEHQGASRLLGRRVHAPPASCSSRPSTSPCIWAACRRRWRPPSAPGSTSRAGDQVVLNDPFAGGTHLNDVTLVAPCHAGGRLIGWVANRAHHADVGGMAPGSIPPAAVEIYQEGLRIPPLRFTPRGRRPARGQFPGAPRAAGRSRSPGRRQPGRASHRLAALADRSGRLRRGGGLRGAPDAGRPGGAARWHVDRRGRARLHRARIRSNGIRWPSACG